MRYVFTLLLLAALAVTGCRHETTTIETHTERTVESGPVID